MRAKYIFREVKKIMGMTLFLAAFLLVVPWIIVKTVKIETTSTMVNAEVKEIDIAADKIAKIYNVDTNSIEEINVEEYIKGVVASEMPVSFEKEALKAQAVAARTFYYSRINNKCNLCEGAKICNSVHCQVYKSKEECCELWNENKRQEYWNKISEAVEETKNEVIVYEGEIVKYPQYFSTSWGKTENSVDVFSSSVPYLQSTDSLGEDEAPKYSSSIEKTIKDFVNIINNTYNTAGVREKELSKQINILSNTSAGAVKQIKLGNVTIGGTEFRKLFDLNSTNFRIQYEDEKVIINCKGYGHGVGMSQWGANIMAKEGHNYEEILKHYYNGVYILKVNVKNER